MENISRGKTQIFDTTKRVLLLVLILFVFLVSLNLMSGGFKLLGKDIAEQIITIRHLGIRNYTVFFTKGIR